MVTLYNVISADGFIARKDGSEDFIPDERWGETLVVFMRYDTIVMGRHSYEVMQQYEPEALSAFEALPIRKVVLTRNESFSAKPGYAVAHSVEDAVRLGANVLVSSGPVVIAEFLAKGLVDRIILDRVSVSIGEGMEPFPREIYEKFAGKIEIHEEN